MEIFQSDFVGDNFARLRAAIPPRLLRKIAQYLFIHPKCIPGNTLVRTFFHDAVIGCDDLQVRNRAGNVGRYEFPEFVLAAVDEHLVVKLVVVGVHLARPLSFGSVAGVDLLISDDSYVEIFRDLQRFGRDGVRELVESGEKHLGPSVEQVKADVVLKVEQEPRPHPGEVFHQVVDGEAAAVQLRNGLLDQPPLPNAKAENPSKQEL